MPTHDDHMHPVSVERSLLATLLHAGDAYAEISATIRAAHFCDRRHALIYGAVEQAARESQPISVVTVKDVLQRQGGYEAAGGDDYLDEVYCHVPAGGNVEWFAGRLVEAWKLRQLVEASRANIKAITDGGTFVEEIIEGCVERVLRIADQDTVGGPIALADDIQVAYQTSLDAREKPSSARIATGYAKLDCYLGGLQRGSLIVLAARTGMGKTALALNIAAQVAAEPAQRVVVFSMEMTRKEIADRVLAREAGLDVQRVALGLLDDSQRRKLAAAAARVAGPCERILLDAAGTITPAMIRAHVRRLQRRQPVSLVVVDYLQLVTSAGRAENQNVRIGQISRELKSMAMDLDVPVLALSQFSREAARRDGEPQLSDLRDSGSIENDANAVVFIHHDDMAAWQKGESDLATIIIAKNRNGMTGRFKMRWLGSCVTFEEIVGA